MWDALERIPLEGTHFRRQVPIGPFVVDFACLAAHLVIELDGASHTGDDAAARDRRRQSWLEGEGYRVLRFWNGEVLANLDGVLETIYASLHGTMTAEPRRIVHRRRAKTHRGHPTPDLRSDPPPAGEGGGA